MRLATWNVNSVHARLPRLLEWLVAVKPDVVCLQETKTDDESFPRAEVGGLGYTAATHGDGRWNGVAILSSAGIEDVRRGLPDEPGFPGPEARAIAATCHGVRVWSVYVPNGRSLDSPHLNYKLAWLAALRDMLAAQDLTAPLAVCGDFNIAPADDDVWDPADFAGATHVSPAERDALAAVIALGFTDVRARALKGPRPFTYWDYRGGNFHRGLGMRIDLILAGPALAPAILDAYVDREARKGKAPSDHAPVVLDLDLPPRPAGRAAAASR
jgi:exodeoxyribonuclease III